MFAAVYLLIWGVDLLTGFSTFSATVLALTFVFGNRCGKLRGEGGGWGSGSAAAYG